MRRLLTLTMLIALILGGLWLGGETLLARELRKIAVRDPGITIGTVTELREAGRIGVHIADLHLDRPGGRLELPGADLWLSPLAPTEARLDLPAQAILDPGTGPLTLGLSATDARLRLRPLAGMALDRIALTAGPMTLDGAPLAEALDLTARRTRPGPEAPQTAAAAYDLDLAIRQLDLAQLFPALPERLAQGSALPGPLTLDAQGQIWLDAAPAPARLTAETRPAIEGARLDRAELTLGPLGARLIGQIDADAQGRAQGRLVLYTADARAFLQLAADLGWLPPRAVKLAGQMLGGLSALPIPPAAASDGGQTMSFPAPAKGELRLPLTLSGGHMSLGPIPLGPAPQLR